jgi:hypothetical protein
MISNIFGLSIEEKIFNTILHYLYRSGDRLCVLVVRVLARVRFPALPEKKVVCLERGPLSLVSTTEELLDRKVAAPV